MNLSPEVIVFLKDLKEHNERDWFQANKPRFETVKKEFESFIDALILEISKFDKSISHHKAKNCVFRIYRDVRFSKDKSPYKTHFGAHITSAEKRSDIHTKAGYYVHVGADEITLAGGAYLPQGDWIKAIRQEIHFDANKLKKIISAAPFKKYFGEMEGEKLKTAPRDYPMDHPEIELLKFKSFLAVHHPTQKDVESGDFLKHATNAFKALKPFDDFLNEASVN